jgi:hypothetical protein
MVIIDQTHLCQQRSHISILGIDSEPIDYIQDHVPHITMKQPQNSQRDGQQRDSGKQFENADDDDGSVSVVWLDHRWQPRFETRIQSARSGRARNNCAASSTCVSGIRSLAECKYPNLNWLPYHLSPGLWAAFRLSARRALILIHVGPPIRNERTKELKEKFEYWIRVLANKASGLTAGLTIGLNRLHTFSFDCPIIRLAGRLGHQEQRRNDFEIEISALASNPDG